MISIQKVRKHVYRKFKNFYVVSMFIENSKIQHADILHFEAKNEEKSTK